MKKADAVKGERQSNFELLRIISMLMIVAHHFVAKNAFNVDTEIIGLTVNKLFLQFIGNHAFIGNNLFFMISAWFLCDVSKEYGIKKSLKSVWKIERQMLFYSILICIVLILWGGVYKPSFSCKVCVPAKYRHLVVSYDICRISSHQPIPL